MIEFECEATSSVAARAQFHEAAAASVDHLSYAMNLPVVLAQITIVDTKHGITTAELIPPYPAKQLSLSVSKIHPTLAPAYAMYREAKNAGSPFYRFFCLYKILEGLLVFLRGELYEKAKAKQINLPKFTAKVPAYEHMADELQQYVGKPMHKFFEEVLQTNFRNSLAHFANDTGAALDVNGLQEIERYSKVVHLTDLCCREAIAHFESCLALVDPVPLTND